MANKNKILETGSLIVAVGLAAQPALAQDTAEPAVDIGTIVVTGDDDRDVLQDVDGLAAKAASTGTRGLPGDLATTPRSVSVVTERQIQDQGARSLEDAIAYTPGVTTQTFGLDSRYDQFAIRGFDAQVSGNYRDGMPLRLYGWGAWRTETFGVERIEVLRGPTASLYGANEPGGLVNSVTKRPTFDDATEVMARTSSHGGLELGVDDTGILNDTLAYRFVALGGRQGTQFDDVDESRLYLAPSITWAPTDQTNLTLFAQYQQDNVGDTYVLVPQYGSQLPNPLGTYGPDFYSNNPNRNDISTTQSYLGYEFDHEFDSGLTLRSRARFARNEWTNETAYADSFFSSTILAGFPPISGAIDAATLVNFDVDQITRQTTFDNALLKEFNTGTVSGTVLGGVDYYRGEYDNTYGFGYGGTHLLQTGQIFPLPGVPTTPRVTQETQDVSQTGLYVLGNFEIGENIVVDAGLRHDWVNIDATRNGLSQSNDKSYTSGNLGASYNFTNGVTVYGALSRSFNLPPAGIDGTGKPLDVEEANSYELGARFRPLGKNSLIGLALFNIEKKNTIQPIAGFPGAFEQVGEVRSRGIELEANYAFDNGVSVLGSYTYIDGEITQDAANQGNQLARIPKNAAALWLAYDVQTVPGLRFGAGARYTGSRYSDSANTEAFKLDAVTVFDASVTYEKNGWVGTLAARNLGDKEYVTYCQIGSTAALIPGANVAQAGGCAYGAGRTIELTLSRRF
ncbi:MAG: TonB-dependent siderophore receptor [Marinibacterium sp.]|nr:TonB-dependent siderophore receptor [Marinibacterium sp.]